MVGACLAFTTAVLVIRVLPETHHRAQNNRGNIDEEERRSPLPTKENQGMELTIEGDDTAASTAVGIDRSNHGDVGRNGGREESLGAFADDVQGVVVHDDDRDEEDQSPGKSRVNWDDVQVGLVGVPQ